MGFLDSIRNIKNQIDQIESSVTSSNRSLLEVYELNAQLEQEINIKTQELETANKQMVTLQLVWDMMNSSKPLSSVLSAIASSLQGELGYLNTCVTKHLVDENGSFLQLCAFSGDLFGLTFLKAFNCEPTELRLEYPKDEEIVNAINSNTIHQSTDLSKLIKSVLPKAPEVIVRGVAMQTKAKSYIMVPLAHKNEHFGCLVLFSPRAEATESELKFLNLFARQIELAITIADLFQVVREQAVTDGMTGLHNRRYFEEFIKKEAVRANRQGQKFTVIGIDLDHLKQINDVYGHSYGDMAIKAIADILQKSCRSIDVAARMGGEEFNLILPGVDSQGGLVVAERIRKTIESLELEKVGKITASLGLGTFGEHSEDVDELLDIVDLAMYESKRNGRNQVSVAKPVSETSWQDVAIATFIDILSKHRIPLDTKTSKMLNQKLQEMNVNNDILFQVADTLVSTYNPQHPAGGIKTKIQLASLLAKRFELSKESVDKLKIAVLLYDIGNTMLPKEILSKRSPLNKKEKESIKKHPIIAAREILEPISAINDVIPIIEKHHENWNGTGYPNNLSGENIPIESQIILIVDSYCALLESRPYRIAKSREEALEIIMEDSNSKWSARLANEFAQVMKEDLV